MQFTAGINTPLSNGKTGVVILVNFWLKFADKKGPVSIVNSEVIYEEQQKSLSVNLCDQPESKNLSGQIFYLPHKIPDRLDPF